jgi:hypothetical protein
LSLSSLFDISATLSRTACRAFLRHGSVVVAGAVVVAVTAAVVAACAGVGVAVAPGVSLTPGTTAALAPHIVWMWHWHWHCGHL